MNELQNIKLPDFLLTEWYKDHLIESSEQTGTFNKMKSTIPPIEKTTEVVVTKEPIWHLGDNKKNITIVINQNTELVISEDWKTFLQNVLNACKLSLADVVIVNTCIKKISYQEFTTQFASKYLIVFDVAPSLLQIPAAIPNYDVRVDNNCSIVFSESIGLMLANTDDSKQVKMKLWVSLKKLFGL